MTNNVLSGMENYFLLQKDKKMKSYVGCKVILAEEMDLDTFNSKFNKVIPSPKHISKEGFHVIYPDGYNSWSPKAVFNDAYREITEQERKLIS